MNLLPLYVGPFKVLKRDDKFFRLAVGGQVETVSIDCLKLGCGPFLSDPPCRPRLASILSSCGVSASAASGSLVWRGAMPRSRLVINL
jgi:hypothetical protein